MNPLLFANWAQINRVFCAALYLVALLLTMFIIAHLMPQDTTPHRQVPRGVIVGRH